jgi:hypothetical protein
MVEGRKEDSRFAEKCFDSASLIKEETKPQNQVHTSPASGCVESLDAII